LLKSLATDGRRQRRLYGEATVALRKLLRTADRAARAGRLEVLTPIEAIVAALRTQIAAARGGPLR
jgi:hypothetical protein